jgi:DNA repair exonuclease SbcCD ATPase subunit
VIVEFLDMEIKNFMSFGSLQTIPLRKQGVVRVEGRNLDEPSADSNRAGKSVLVEALSWCLWGRTLRGIKHDAVVNRFAKRDCSVATRFRVAGKIFRFKRYRRHRKHGNHLRLFVGDRLISYRHDDETQSRLERILGCDYTSFTNSVVFGGVRPFASLSDAEQKKILESFLHFEKFNAALARTRDSISQETEKLSELRLRLATEKGVAAAVFEKLTTLQESEKSLRVQRRGRVREIKRAIRAGRTSLRENAETTKLCGLRVRRAERKLQFCRIRDTEFRERDKRLRHLLSSVRNSLRDKTKLEGGPCPVCQRSMTAQTIEPLVTHLTSERRALAQRIKKVQRRKSVNDRRLHHALVYLKGVQKKLIEKESGNTRMLERMSMLRKELDMRSPLSPFKKKIQLAQRKYSRLVSRLLITTHEEQSLKTLIEDLRFWEQGFGNRGIKALIVRDALPVLNTKLREYADKIFEGTAELQFLPSKKTKSGGDRELFNVHYAAKRGSPSYLGESSGGRRRVDVCVLLCFAWISRLSNLLLVDELLDGLDESGRERVLEILSSLRGTILVISHRRELKSKIGRVWTVEKKNGFSRLERAA